jgi:hypothetical protein
VKTLQIASKLNHCDSVCNAVLGFERFVHPSSYFFIFMNQNVLYIGFISVFR